MEIRCDSSAAVTLATGEGSWKTESVANKVYYSREQVEFGLVKVHYVSTYLQAADSLTKFMRGGQEQKRAIELLGLDDVRKLKPGSSEVQACNNPVRFQVNRIFVSNLNSGVRYKIFNFVEKT